MTFSLILISMFFPTLRAYADEPQTVAGSGTVTVYADGCVGQVNSAQTAEKAEAAADQDAAQACKAIGGSSVMAIR